MSSEGFHKRRCIIQKLDFENCIVTNIKTTTRGRKKLRARITRKIESVLEENQQSGNPSPEPSEPPEPKSPVLKSPAFFKRRKAKFSEVGVEHSTIKETPSSPGSPVFKTFKKPKKELQPDEEIESLSGKVPSMDLFGSGENSSSGLQNSFQIDEFTQESKQSVKISSVESADVKNESFSAYSIEGSSGGVQGGSPKLSNRFNCDAVNCETPKPVKRNYKKNSLLRRLHKLQQKQASEKLLWQHQNRKNSTGSLKVSIISFWKEEFNYYLKCQSIASESDLSFLIVDSRWVPNVKKVKEGSVLQLHPPWQKLSVEDSATTVLLNVICLDVLDETKEPFIKKKCSESISGSLFEVNQKLFVDSLFSSCTSGFWC